MDGRSPLCAGPGAKAEPVITLDGRTRGSDRCAADGAALGYLPGQVFSLRGGMAKAV